MKRVLDLVSATVGALLLLPVFLCVSFLVLWRLGRPVLFFQTRAGQYGKPFKIVKFSTMRHVIDARGRPLPDEQRLTPFGRWLRNTSLDELPELWNVINGDMSLVGPRPLLMNYLDRYTPDQARRHEVRPGITGWAQVNGRNTISWEKKFELDLWYVDHQSVFLDLRIIALTLLKVFRRDGVVAPGHATMPEFMGSQSSDAPPGASSK